MLSENFDLLHEELIHTNKHSIYAVKVIGSSHRRIGIPCQDSIKVWADDSIGSIYALADGHGHSRYDLSQYGSSIAVNTVIETILSYSSSFNTKNIFFELLKKDFPKQIFNNWINEVEKDFLKHSSDNNNSNTPPFYKRYGTTLLLSIHIETGLYICQLGDGDIVIVDNDYNFHSPIAKPIEFTGNATYSLVSNNSHTLWDIKFFQIKSPSLLIMCSDGLTNSFEASEFQKFCTSIFKNIKKFGIDSIVNILPDWLENATKKGSGDDISLIISILR